MLLKFVAIVVLIFVSVQRYSKNYSQQTNKIEITALLRLFKIVNTIPFDFPAYLCPKIDDMRIKEVMKEKGCTQQALAERMNVSLSAVKQMVNADSLTTATLEKIGKALGVPLWQFFASQEDVAPKTGTMTVSCPYCGNSINITVGKG